MRSDVKMSNTYRRFIHIPLLLGTWMFWVSYVALCMIWYYLITFSFWGYVAYFILCLVSVSISDLLAYKTSQISIKERIWHWGRNKFDNWEEYGDWLNSTSANELDRLAGLPDDSWEPEIKQP
jgi:hypothetical protein